jgi:hypothetical protein
MNNSPVRRLVNQNISSYAPVAERLQALLAAFELGNEERKYVLFAELAMAALICSDVGRKCTHDNLISRREISANARETAIRGRKCSPN